MSDSEVSWMTDTEMDRKVRKVFETAGGSLAEGWEERAAAATVGAALARAGAATASPDMGRRRRWIAAGTAAVALLVALGFVPFTVGDAAGALQRAMAMAAEAATVHMSARAWGPKGDFHSERWASEDGFSRDERWEGGRLVQMEMTTEGDWRLWYHASEDNGAGYAVEDFDPLERHRRSGAIPRRMTGLSGFSADAFFGSFGRLAEAMGLAPPEMKITERRQRTLWGGLVDVVEAEWTIEGSSHISGVRYNDGDVIRIRAEVDPDTGRLLSMAQDKFEGVWEPRYRAEYEWDVEIPESIREFRPPEGTTLVRYGWWETRADQVLAKAATDDWEVSLHAMDLNRDGDILLSVVRTTSRRSYNCAESMRVEAVGSAGERYSQYGPSGYAEHCGFGYLIARLNREEPGPDPQTVTLRIYPHPAVSEGQSVTFRDIPIPPRRDVDDVFEAETERIQY
jgi:hypothetical protein